MKRFNTYLLVAAMAVSGAGMTAMAQNDMNGETNAPAANATNQPENDLNNNAASNRGAVEAQRMQQIGGQQVDPGTQKDVQGMLVKVVNDAVQTNHFDNLTKHLAKADRDRIGDYASQKHDDLNQAIQQFRQDYKNKYNRDIDLSSNDLNNLMVYSGQDKKSATAELPNPDLANHANYTNGAMNKNAEDLNKNSRAENNRAGATNSGAIADRNLNTPGNDVTVSNRSGVHSGSDTTVATAGVPTGQASVDNNRNSTVHGNDVTANPGLATGNQVQSEANSSTPAAAGGTVANDRGSALAAAGGVTLNLINEGSLMNSWKIDIPNEISGQQLHDSLLRHIRMLDDQKAAWPSSADQANRLTAYHVLQAFNDTAMASERY